jgi:hypothetical protein
MIFNFNWQHRETHESGFVTVDGGDIIRALIFARRTVRDRKFKGQHLDTIELVEQVTEDITE